MAEQDAYSFLDSIKVETTELPQRTGNNGAGRERAVQNNPFVQPVSESEKTKTGRGVTVAARHAVKTVYLIRQAAADLALGVRVVLMVDGEKVEQKAIKELNKNKNVRILFQGQPKRKYSPRRSKKNAETIEPTEPADE